MGAQCSQECQQCASRPCPELIFEPLAERPVGHGLEETVKIGVMTAERQSLGTDLPRLRLGKQDTWAEVQKGNGAQNSVSSMSLWSQQSVEPSSPPPLSTVGELDTDASRAPFVEVSFDARGEERTIRIYRRPLGADFIKVPFGPVTVSKVEPQSYAWGVGLEKGWILRRVNGEDMSRKTSEETQATLKRGIATLPARTLDLS